MNEGPGRRTVTRSGLRLIYSTRPPLRVGILGGGITGLASAWFLLRAGHKPVVFASADELDEPSTAFEHAGYTMDRFPQVMLDGDGDLRAVVDDLGLRDALHWSPTRTALHVDGTPYGFDTPRDLLCFRALGVTDRLRAGLAALYVTRGKRRVHDLDAIPAGAWLRTLFGRRAYESVWDPLLRARFGDHRDSVPADRVWFMLNHERNGEPGVRGYPRCGYGGLLDTLARRVAEGGEVRLHHRVRAIEPQAPGIRLGTERGTEAFDAVISTLPLPLLRRVAGAALRDLVPLPELAYQGVVSVLVVARRRLGRFYSTAVVDPTFPFDKVVETTHVIPPEWIGGRHLIHVLNRCDAASESYNRPEAVLRRQAVQALRRLYPDFGPGDVEATYVFRAPRVEPAWTPGLLDRRAAPRIAGTRLYLCTSAQAYPRTPTWNTSVALARDTVIALTGDLGQAAAEAA